MAPLLEMPVPLAVGALHLVAMSPVHFGLCGGTAERELVIMFMLQLVVMFEGCLGRPNRLFRRLGCHFLVVQAQGDVRIDFQTRTSCVGASCVGTK